jgi:dATP pyrophosphohydrolase
MSGAPAPVIRVIDCHVARETAEGWRYLVLQRSPGRLDAGRWRIVTGKIEDGETAWQTALRELREETSLTPVRLLAVPYVNQFYEWQQDRINAIPIFLAVVASDATPTLNAEHTDHAWLPLDEAADRLAWPAMRDGLRAADALLTDPRAPLESLEVALPLDERATN